ncbi:protection of telomeres protein 1-like isoform X1 [Salarias fasciatus]|uniref:protection of telomeres protein 1-like isoform X1 n=1 Tax=Salarias fasciatus TaxID=181472 RepID=UPI0011769B7F|nr:protection of telomeres protein 1-like isoform X1 [Salarias fasciatus]
MSVHVLVAGAGPDSQLPSHLTRIPISSVSTGTDSTNRTVKGNVLHKGPLVSSEAHGFLLKAVIQDEDSSINVVLLGALAKAFSEAVSPGDVVAASGFSVGKSPTVHKDKLHACNLLLHGGHACVYLFRPPPPPDPRSPVASKRSSAPPSEVSKTAKTPKYMYVRLDELKAAAASVNVYGVVVFFKQPFRSRGTDWCSSLKIVDQSNKKVGCTLFCEKLEDHPQIFKNGDIIRMHRVKTQLYNGAITLVNTFGFSAVTFDGAPGSAVEPRTSSRSFHFDQDDRRRVEELRSWAGGQAALPRDAAAVPLSSVRPRAFFDLTCQLLAKAPMDTTCTLLRVWDGTRCPHPQVEVMVEPHAVEGPASFSKDKESLVANVFVYDNHVESARALKPGDFLRIYNLRALQGSSKGPGLATEPSEAGGPLIFHLHGGTSYGRGIRVLSENCPDVQELKRVLETFSRDEEDSLFEDSDLDLLDVWSTPPEFLDGDTEECCTERRCGHGVQPESLAELKRSGPGGVHHVRAQLRSFQPRRLHQALKLYCSRCTSMQDVPDEEQLSEIFSAASRDSPCCSPPPWLLSGDVLLPGGRPALRVHLSAELLSEGRAKELIFLQGSTLEEACLLADGYQNVVPVRSSGGGLALLDLTAPFLFRGGKRYYGCGRCSEASVRELSAEGGQPLDEDTLAGALGVRLLQLVLLFQLELQDATDTLDVFLWTHAESFFRVSAESVAVDQKSQDLVCQTLEALCPPGGSAAQRPWLDLCVAAYRAEGDGESSQLCYQICHTSVIPP